VDVEGEAAFTAESRLIEIGPGLYSWVLMLCIGAASMAECLEMGSVAPIHSSLARTFHFTHDQRAALPLITFGGSGIGLLLSGPICDWRGRREALLISLATITIVMFTTAGLPNDTNPEIVLILRFFSGLAAAVQAPAGCVLAVESSPKDVRPRIVFGICVMGAIGYLIEALAVGNLMPHFGERPTDHWRWYCYLVGGASLFTMPLMYILQESPSWLAAVGDAEGCVQSLDRIAYINGKPPISTEAAQQFARPGLLESQPLVEQRGRGRSFDRGRRSSLVDVAGTVLQTASTSWVTFILILLSLLDSSRAFMMSGSAYLWKDLFMLVEGQFISPARLNVISSIAPIIGLIVSVQFISIGVQRLAFLSAMVASLAFAALSSSSIRLVAGRLLVCIVGVKSAYGPLGTCVSLIKAEAFPTELRASGFAFVSFMAKITATLAPTMVEALKEDETADSWSVSNLHAYILLLLFATLMFSLLILMVPDQTGEGKSLRDFVAPRKGHDAESYGAAAMASETSAASWEQHSDSD